MRPRPHNHAGKSGTSSTTFSVDVSGVTDRGRVRTDNQDQVLVADLTKSLTVTDSSLPDHHRELITGPSTGKLLVVADGMGGHAGGARASALAVEEMIRYVLNVMPWCFRLQDSNEHDFEETLRDALLRCQRRIEQKAGAQPELRSMGTTLTMGYLLPPRLYVLHAGDSRCYLFRDGDIEQITIDHTVAQKLLEEGVLEPDEVKTSRYSHVLWNALGGGSKEVLPELHRVKLEPGDALLFCTDGLTNHLDDEEIAAVLGRARSADEASRALVEAANNDGGTDNITVIVARLIGDTPRPLQN